MVPIHIRQGVDQTMTTEHWSLAISALGVLLSGGFSYVVTRFASNRTRDAWLKAQIDKYIEFSITYPYLDSDTYAATWRRGDCSEDAERYQNFCCFAFNLLERIWVVCGGNTKKIEEYVYCSEIIKRHRNWWITDPHNPLGYDPGFVQFIGSVQKGNSRE